MTATLAGAVRVTVTEREARQAKDVLGTLGRPDGSLSVDLDGQRVGPLPRDVGIVLQSVLQAMAHPRLRHPASDFEIVHEAVELVGQFVTERRHEGRHDQPDQRGPYEDRVAEPRVQQPGRAQLQPERGKTRHKNQYVHIAWMV